MESYNWEQKVDEFQPMADSPEQLAKVLAELEARKESLRNRWSSIDSAVQGPADQPVAEVQLNDEVPVRENPALAAHQANQHINARTRQEAVQPQDVENVEQRSPAQRPSQLRRPIPAAPPERRKQTGNLNIYVNQNTEWAARQFVPAHSPRAVFRHKTGHRCPKCGSQDTRISATRGISDMFMFMFDYSNARCRNCDTRFRIWQSRHDDEDDTQELEPQPSGE